MNAFTRNLKSCISPEEVSHLVHDLIYDPHQLDDATAVTADQRSRTKPELQSRLKDSSLASRLYHVSASLHDLEIEPKVRAAVASSIRLILDSDGPALCNKVDTSTPGLHGGALDGCFEMRRCGIGDNFAGSCLRLPTLNWHDFRKGYSVLMWVKPSMTLTDVEPTNRLLTLYRFRSFARRGKYIDATLSPFVLSDGVDASNPAQTLTSRVTIIAFDPTSHSSNNSPLPSIEGDIHLVPEVWQLLAITHSFPYLKNPKVSISVNGNPLVSGDIAYPSPDDGIVAKSRGDFMEDCVLLENVVEGIGSMMSSLCISAVSMYKVDIPVSVLACAAECGPNNAFEGRILQPYPSVAPNKNSKVGLPNSGVENFIGKIALAYNPRLVHDRSSATSDSGSVTTIQKICVNMSGSNRYPGSVEGVRPGLIKPSVVEKNPITNMNPSGSMYLEGNVHVHTRMPSHETSNLSLAWQAANGLGACLLPFSLSLPPHSSSFQHLQDMQSDSNRHLYSLLSQRAELAVVLLKLFAATLRVSSAFRDEATQKNLPYSVANLSRRVLIRGRQMQGRNGNKGFFKGAVDFEDLSFIESVHVPDEFGLALVEVLSACCGVVKQEQLSMPYFEDCRGALHVRRTSDLAEMALHGIGLDLSVNCLHVTRAIASFYGFPCDQGVLSETLRRHLGRFIRMKLTVDTFLGMIKLHHSSVRKEVDANEFYKNKIVKYLGAILTVLLEASLSDPKSINAAEKDVSACVQLLVECRLASIPAGVVLNGLNALISRRIPSSVDDQVLLEQRLARNLVHANYHDCVGPVILGRVLKKLSIAPDCLESDTSSHWQIHWLLALEQFIWITQLIKPEEGSKLCRSVGKWLIASAEAGALRDVCLPTSMNQSHYGQDGDISSILFGGTNLQESEKSRRLRVALPMLPALVFSLLQSISDKNGLNGVSTEQKCNNNSFQQDLESLTRLLASAGVALKSPHASKEHSKSNSNLSFFSVPGSKDLASDWGEWSGISIMLKIANRIESLLVQLRKKSEKDTRLCEDDTASQDDEKSWVNVSNDDISSIDISNRQISELEACQDLALDTCAAILIKASSTDRNNSWQAWTSVIHSLSTDGISSNFRLNDPLNDIQAPQHRHLKNLFCRLASMVIQQTFQGVISEEQISIQKHSASIDICNVAENLYPMVTVAGEHHIFPRIASDFGRNDYYLSQHQCHLLKAFIQLLKLGREELGWAKIDEHRSRLHDAADFDSDTTNDTSKILQPLLRPCLNVCLEVYVCCFLSLPAEIFLDLVEEIKQTLQAALVGLHPLVLSVDIGLESLSILRKIDAFPMEEEVEGNEQQIKRCEKSFLLVWFVSNELRIRMENDREIRRKNLITHFPGDERRRLDSYDDTDAAAHELLERMMLGTDEPLVPVQTDFFKSEKNPPTVKNERHSFEGFAEDDSNVALERVLNECLCEDGKTAPKSSAQGESVVCALKDFLDNYESDSLMITEDMRMLYMVDKPDKEALLQHADAVASFLEIQSASTSEDQSVPNSAEALQYRRFVRCTNHSDTITRKFICECLCLSCKKRAHRSERSLTEAGSTGVSSRLASYPLDIISAFDRKIPKHFFGGEEEGANIDGDPDDGDDIKKAVRLSRRSTLTIRDITKINIGGEEETGSDTSSINLESVSELNSHKNLVDLDLDCDDANNRERSDSNNSLTTEASSIPSNVSMESVSLNSSRYESICCPGDGSFASGGAGRGAIEKMENILHVMAQGSRSGTLLLTNSHLIIEYDSEFFDGELLSKEEAKYRKLTTSEDRQTDGPRDKMTDADKFQRITASLRVRSMRWILAETAQIYLRRYRLRDSALELFFIPSAGSGEGSSCAHSSVFLDFGSGKAGNIKRDNIADAIMRLAPGRCVKQWPEKSALFMQEAIHHAQNMWVNGRMNNMDYLIRLNTLAGRSFNDLCQYPIMPWVLSNYTSEEMPDLSDPSNFRDLSLPVGALNAERLAECVQRYESFQDTIPSFMYGSHYSTSAGVVLHFLVRLHPFAGLHRQLQSGHFDVADRLFSSVARTWDMCTGTSAAEVKELTPEWYCNPSFLRNGNDFGLGVAQDGEAIGDVQLPPYAKGSPDKFIEIMRCALESDVCSAMLPSWIDLIFGFKQKGPDAVKAFNVFFYLTYYGSIDVAAIEDESLRSATELQIAHFGQCPIQLFRKTHPKKKRRCPYTGRYGSNISSPLPNLVGSYDAVDTTKAAAISNGVLGGSALKSHEERALPFLNAPLSYWVHIHSPPPGPHAELFRLRFVGRDRCLAIDSKGIYHFFRWAWKSDSPHLIVNTNDDGPIADEESSDEDNVNDEASRTSSKKKESKHVLIRDEGCFIAQRELHGFHNIPRLPFINSHNKLSVAISRTLFKKYLLILSDGNGKGDLAVQFVDPSKGIVKLQAIIPNVHAARISSIHTAPINHAFGEGELVMLGSNDGTASVWRFISSDFLPLRPKFRLKGHRGKMIAGVCCSPSLGICVAVSRDLCCIYSLADGTLLRSFGTPDESGVPFDEHQTIFAETNAVCLSERGYLVLACQSFPAGVDKTRKPVVTLQLFSLEGQHLGARALDSWRGVPHEIKPFAEDSLVLVCAGGGVSLHRLSSLSPLDFVDEWRIFEDPVDVENDQIGGENQGAVFDIDIGPSLSLPVVVAAACSAGALRLHALPGISPWSEETKKSVTVTMVGEKLAKPAKTIKHAVGSVTKMGNKFVGLGSEIGKEALSDVKERGVGGFLGNVFGKAKSAVSSRGQN